MQLSLGTISSRSESKSVKPLGFTFGVLPMRWSRRPYVVDARKIALLVSSTQRDKLVTAQFQLTSVAAARNVTISAVLAPPQHCVCEIYPRTCGGAPNQVAIARTMALPGVPKIEIRLWRIAIEENNG
jgi:hypothetical protein